MRILGFTNSVVLIFFVAGASFSQALSAQDGGLDSDSLDQTGNASQSEREASRKETGNHALWSAGVNTSNILHEEGPWLSGYTIGITFIFKLSDRFSLVIPGSRTKINAAPRNIEGIRYGNNAGDPHYKAFTDWEISFTAIEVPLLLSYRISFARNYTLTYMLGPGLVIGRNESSEIKNITITDEIVGYSKHGDLGPGVGVGARDHSGLDIVSGIGIYKYPLYAALLYHYRLASNDFLPINGLNSISLRLGFNPVFLSDLVQRLIKSNKN